MGGHALDIVSVNYIQLEEIISQNNIGILLRRDYGGLHSQQIANTLYTGKTTLLN